MSNNTKIMEGGKDPRESALDKLFSDYSLDSITVVDLPSRGKFYDNFQGIEINPLTYLDEQKILGSRDTNVDTVSQLLAKATEGVDVGNLLSMDKIYLLMKVREASYGDKYEFKVTCPECSTDVSTDLILSKHLNMVKIPEDMEDPRTITLPQLKAKVQIRFPRGREESLLKDTESVYKNAYKFVTSIEGTTDPVFISKAIKRLHIKDIKKIIFEILQSEYGVDPRFVFECPECKHSETMSIPLDINFFSVS